MEPQESQALPAHGSIRGQRSWVCRGESGLPRASRHIPWVYTDQKVLRASRGPGDMDGWMDVVGSPSKWERLGHQRSSGLTVLSGRGSAEARINWASQVSRHKQPQGTWWLCQPRASRGPFEHGRPAPGCLRPSPAAFTRWQGANLPLPPLPDGVKGQHPMLPCLPSWPRSDLVSATRQLPGFLPVWALYFLRWHLPSKYRFRAPPQTHRMGFSGSRSRNPLLQKACQVTLLHPGVWEPRPQATRGASDSPKLTSVGDQAALEPEVSGRERSQCVSLVCSSHALPQPLPLGLGARQAPDLCNWPFWGHFTSKEEPGNSWASLRSL